MQIYNFVNSLLPYTYFKPNVNNFSNFLMKFKMLCRINQKLRQANTSNTNCAAGHENEAMVF